jgi:glycyl-tRNA synthetase beta chain
MAELPSPTASSSFSNIESARWRGGERGRHTRGSCARPVSMPKFFSGTRTARRRSKIRLEKLKSIDFTKARHPVERVERIARLARRLASGPTARDPAPRPKRRGRLGQGDLVTEMVGASSPSLQGLNGPLLRRPRRASTPQSRPPMRSTTSRSAPPTASRPDPVSGGRRASADKLDTLVGFWGHRREADGEQGPYALSARRWGVSAWSWRNA